MAGGSLAGPPSQGGALSTRGGLTETQRGMLLSTMSDASVAVMLGRGVAWVKRQRGVLADLPVALTVQDRAATAAKPWRPDDDPFEPLKPVEIAPPAPRQTWREAGMAAVRATPPRPVPRPSVGSSPAVRPQRRSARTEARPERRWGDLCPAAGSTRPEPRVEITPDPALLSEKHYERTFVRAKRAAGVSWFNIAKMTGRTAPWLSATYGGGPL